MSCIETLESGVYGTRMVPGLYQGTSSEVPGEDRSEPVLLPFQMLMLLWWVFGRASVTAIKLSIGLSEHRFPLTPALSLEERENHLPRCDKSRRAGLSGDGRRGTLSPRERAGVRGKETPKLERRLRQLPSSHPLP